MPQIYYGFDNELKPFANTIKNWNDLIKNKVKLVPVLALYKVGEVDNLALSGKYEWINNHDILRREVNYSKTLNNYHGYSLFRYSYLLNDNSQEELNNLKK